MHAAMRHANRDQIAYWRQTLPGVPAGLILPFTGGSLSHADWGYKTMSRDCLVRGHMLGTTTIDSQNNETKQTLAVTAAGYHVGGNTTCAPTAGGMGGFAEADHDHGGALVEDHVPLPDRLNARPVQAQVDTDEIPGYSAFGAYDTIDRTSGGWARWTPTTLSHAILHATQSSIAWKNIESTINQVLPASGTHDHGGHGGVAGGTATTENKGIVAGDHTHGLSVVNYTLSLTVAIFNWWCCSANATKNVRDVRGMWAMIDSETLPEGWAYVENFDYHYIAIAKAIGDAGQKITGTNKVSATGTTPSSGDHEHFNGTVTSNTEPNRLHIDVTGAHTHVLSYPATTYVPSRVYWSLIKRLW